MLVLGSGFLVFRLFRGNSAVFSQVRRGSACVERCIGQTSPDLSA